MVRHEAAEALGGIASDGAEDEGEVELPESGVLAVLREWAGKTDAPGVVRESCQVAIDMWEVRQLCRCDLPPITLLAMGAKFKLMSESSTRTRRSNSIRSTR
jgi:hypothetical protein